MRKGSGSVRWLCRLFLLSAAVSAAGGWYYVDRSVPDRVSVVQNEKEEFIFSLPWMATLSSESAQVSLGNQSDIPADQITVEGRDLFSIYGDKLGSYQVGVRLLGLFKIKDIQVDVVETRYAMACGSPAGIYLKADGVMVIGTGRITDSEGIDREPAYGKLKSGDYIEAWNGVPLNTKEELMDAVGNSRGEEAVLQIRRQGEDMEIPMQPVRCADGEYRLGAWVRDDTQGIGTITYVDENGNFAALGHGISDSDTGELVETEEGAVYTTKIMEIEKGRAGTPGLLSGIIYYGPQSHLGTIRKNTEQGIFGTLDRQRLHEFQGESMELARPQEITEGPAVIRCQLEGETRDYTIEIEKVDLRAGKKNKSLVIRVTDPRLLELTGGIVQGMSGSPIIQNGKLAGAVTHVFVQDATRGYGILIEHMAEPQAAGAMSAERGK